MRTKWGKVIALTVVTALFIAGTVAYRRATQPESQRFILEHSDKFVLYSITRMGVEDSVKTEGEFEPGLTILGHKEITDAKLRARLVKALYDGLKVPDDFAQADCFFPAYGIRATRGKRIVSVGLCYGCGNIEFYEDGKTTRLPTKRDPDAIFKQAVARAHLRREQDVETDG